MHTASQKSASLLIILFCYALKGGKEGIINPMVFNMAPAYENAKYPNIWISTSRIKGKAHFNPISSESNGYILNDQQLGNWRFYWHCFYLFP